MSKKISVFICMPYGDHNTPEQRLMHTENAMQVWHNLYDTGFEAYCPLLSHYLHEFQSRPREKWLAHSMYWLEKCDCVYVPEGVRVSEGMRRELERAMEIKKPIYQTIESMKSLASGQRSS